MRAKTSACAENVPMERLQASTSNPYGFTLIELLVVVAIIAVLISILVPSLDEAREQARRVVCGSNLRMIGQAAYLYAEDYDNHFPVLTHLSSEGWRWAGNLTYALDWADDRPMRPLNPYLNITNTVISTTGKQAPDIASPTRCPSDVYPYWNNGYVKIGNHYRTYGTSYYYNALGSVVPTHNGLKGITLSEVRRAAEVVLSCDYAVTYAKGLSEGSVLYHYLGPHDSERPWGNCVFVDGHVSWVLFNDSGVDWWEGEGYTFVAQ
jgi:prepilin-type N-terminal cleavage/methylation domain-containing protein/prepilin-type processing-associated H-X9-DG protein